MESARKLLSSRASARPLSTAVGRPLTGMTNVTGLLPPKSSRDRGTASVRRQIQDKSYWMALLNAKMNELHQEIGRLNRATEQMKNNESKVSLMQAAATSLAKELAEKSSLLSAYNEYFERLRFEGSIKDVEKEIEMVKEDNELLIEELESKYKDKKENERSLNNLESNFKLMQTNWSNFLMKLEPEQQQRYQELDQQNKKLNINCEQLEKQINQLKNRVNQLEQGSEVETDSIFRREVLHSLERLRKLENQREELFSDAGAENDYESERSSLLAQVKRDNRAINQLEQDRLNLENELAKLKQMKEEYNEENVSKFNEFYLQEKTINDFFVDYDDKHKNEIEQLNNLSIKVKNEMELSSRYLTQISILKDTADQNLGNTNIDDDLLTDRQINDQDQMGNYRREGNDRLQLLLNEKRKLTLDLAKMEQLTEKVTEELKTLKVQIKKLNEDIEHYDNLDQLKQQARTKIDNLNEKKSELIKKLDELRGSESVKRQQFEKINAEFDKENSIYKKISKFENRLAELEQRSKALYDEIEEYDYEHLKLKAFEELAKYNQKLLGF